MGYYRKKKKTKRTLTPEQIEKMQEGRRKAQEAREEAIKTKKRVEMLSDLDRRLIEGKKQSESKFIPKSKYKHKHRTYK